MGQIKNTSHIFLKKLKTKNNIRKKALIEALKKTLGIVTTACQSVGIDRGRFYYWYNNDAKFKKAVDDVQNITLDFVESQLYKSIQNGSDTATIFYLKCKGKKRGFNEHDPVDNTEKIIITPIQFIDTDTKSISTDTNDQ